MNHRRWLKKSKNTLIYYAVLILVQILRAMPEKAAQRFMRFMGRLAFRVAAAEREKVIRNLEHVYGEKLDVGQRAKKAERIFEMIGSNGAAALRIPNYIAEGLEKWVSVTGLEHLENAMARGRGVLALTGHIGSWELLAAFVAQSGFPLAVVGKKIYDKRIDNLLVGWRREAGMINISRDGAARHMLQWLRQGKMLGVLIDQDTRVESEFVPFMGPIARTPVAPMLLAQRVGAAIVPMAIHQQADGRHRVTILPELDLEPDDKTVATRQNNLSRCNAALEKLIALDDCQWVWMHERWKSQPKKNEPVL